MSGLGPSGQHCAVFAFVLRLQNFTKTLDSLCIPPSFNRQPNLLLSGFGSNRAARGHRSLKQIYAEAFAAANQAVELDKYGSV